MLGEIAVRAETPLGRRGFSLALRFSSLAGAGRACHANPWQTSPPLCFLSRRPAQRGPGARPEGGPEWGPPLHPAGVCQWEPRLGQHPHARVSRGLLQRVGRRLLQLLGEEPLRVCFAFCFTGCLHNFPGYIERWRCGRRAAGAVLGRRHWTFLRKCPRCNSRNVMNSEQDAQPFPVSSAPIQSEPIKLLWFFWTLHGATVHVVPFNSKRIFFFSLFFFSYSTIA